MTDSREKSRGPRGALGIALIYAVFASSWILFSDKFLGTLNLDPDTWLKVSMLKGWLFVGVTSLLLYGMTRRLVNRCVAAHQREIAAETSRRASQENLLLFIEHAPAALAMFDRDMRYLAVSRRWLDDYGLVGKEIIGTSHYDVFPEIPERWKEVHRRGLAGEVLRSEEDPFERSDGHVQWLRWEVRPWRLDAGMIGGIVIFSEDVTERKLVESELRIAATAFESQQAMMITDQNQKILRVNEAFTVMTGYAPQEVIGRTPALQQSGRHDSEFYKGLWDILDRTQYWQGEIWNRRKNGEIYPCLVSISAVENDAGSVTHYVGTQSDMSQHRQAEETIHALSFYDPLTKLPNRKLLLELLRQALLSSERTACRGAVIYVDLDDFSLLNDTRGHAVGDLALSEAARRLTASVHGDDTVARVGSDEFVVVVGNLHAEDEQAALQAREIAERLLDALRQPMILAGLEYVFSASMGISLFKGSATPVEELLKQADASMYQVKRQGHDRIHFFDVQMQAALEERVSLEFMLRRAIPKQLLLYYQLQVDERGDISGAEVLIRWEHPGRGMISPAEFIPLAEETGLILPIGHWVLETACHQLKAWEASLATRHLTLAVNVSAKQFQQADFVAQVIETIRTTGADPAKLKLELTESMLFEHAETVIGKMSALKALGVRFSLDDFGTGFSSLSYLKRLPLDQLKIDQSFVRDVLTNPHDAAIVRTIIALGQSLGLTVIAEGVETEGQRNFLAVHGCHSYQGYFLGRPVPLVEFENQLAA